MDQRQQFLSGAAVAANGAGDQLVGQLPAGGPAPGRAVRDVSRPRSAHYRSARRRSGHGRHRGRDRGRLRGLAETDGHEAGRLFRAIMTRPTRRLGSRRHVQTSGSPPGIDDRRPSISNPPLHGRNRRNVRQRGDIGQAQATTVPPTRPEPQPLEPRPAVPCAIGTLFGMRAHPG